MSQWIAAITRGHNGGICLLKDGKIVMSGDKSLAHKLEKEGYSFLN